MKIITIINKHVIHITNIFKNNYKKMKSAKQHKFRPKKVLKKPQLKLLH